MKPSLVQRFKATFTLPAANARPSTVDGYVDGTKKQQSIYPSVFMETQDFLSCSAFSRGQMHPTCWRC